jgi:hypothetical protein
LGATRNEVKNMRVALGFKAHSGWAALVALGMGSGGLSIVARERIELAEEPGALWATQPYHAAETLPAGDARQTVKRGIAAARRMAVAGMRAVLKRLRESEHEVVACGVLVPAPMPEWSTEEILAVHFRMHKAEGVLFPDVLARAADELGVALVTVPERQLDEHAEKALARQTSELQKTIAALGKSVGAPWGKDQKSAALAALIALGRNPRR